jgi:hypothetical protein
MLVKKLKIFSGVVLISTESIRVISSSNAISNFLGLAPFDASAGPWIVVSIKRFS